MTTTLLPLSKRRGQADQAKRPQRGDIQALRALAVGLVLLNHLWPERLTGGYIGVDVFFVISGYLITAHLLREITATGRIKLASFWAKRAKRLLPAAMTVLVFSAVVTAMWLPITNRQSAFDQIGAAGAYLLNWLLAASSLDYFAQGSALSPVTHYWSLSVEEQFYIVWPILLPLGALATRKITHRGHTAVFVAIIAAVGLTSFAWAVHSVATEPAAAYFETTGRAWEFAIGGLIAFVPAISPRLRTAAIPAVWLAWGALAYAAYSFGPTSGVPGFKALIPVLATAAIIWAGDIQHSWAPRNLTSFGPVQALGNISYSLYLWHWPLIVAAPIVLQRGLTAKDKAVILLVTFALAYLTKRFIEDPVRSSRLPLMERSRHVLLLTAASMALLLACTVPASAQVGAEARASALALNAESVNPADCFGAQSVLSGTSCPESHEISDPSDTLGASGAQDALVSNGSTCQQVRGNPEILTCSFGKPDGEQAIDVALVGDSHAGMWASALDAISVDRGLRVTMYTNSACPVTLDSRMMGPSDRVPAHQASCVTWREAVVSSIAANPEIDVIVTTSHDRTYRQSDGSADDGSGYVSAWQTWLDAGKQVVVINDTPEQPGSVPECISKSRDGGRSCTVPLTSITTPGPMQRAASQIDSDRFAFVDYSDVFCDSDRCYSVIGGIPAYFDSHHLTAAFARSFNDDFLGNVALE